MCDNAEQKPDFLASPCTALSSLYDLAISHVVKRFKSIQSELSLLPPHIYADILCGLYRFDLRDELMKELSCFENLTRALKIIQRSELHRIFQFVMNSSFYSNTKRPSSLIAGEFVKEFKYKCESSENVDGVIAQGFNIAFFFCESGWYEDTETILLSIKSFLLQSEDINNSRRLIFCYEGILKSQVGFYKISYAEETYREVLEVLSKMHENGLKPNCGLLYSQFSALFLLKSDYNQAYNWSLEALEYIRSSTINSGVVDVLRQASRVCVLKRYFKKAEILIKQAVIIAKNLLREDHVKYADTLNDLGFYYLSSDAIAKGADIYQCCLKMRKISFGCSSKNLLLAMAYEDVSYSSYVYNYSLGFFHDARVNAEKAMALFKSVLPSNHFLLYNCKRIKALILEEIAIEDTCNEVRKKHLEDAHSIHVEALASSVFTFGQNNLQTAKHIGNLGRLYQSMKKFKKAETMHLKSIKIKEEIMDPDDYEVGLSVGHLASLYCYDLGYYRKAEALYLRSIEISKKLFGDGFSGLEYDYNGLLEVYAKLSDFESEMRYIHILNRWRLIQERVGKSNKESFENEDEFLSIDEMLNLLL